MVCLENPEPHIRVFWGAQFVIPSFAQPTPEDGKVLVFAKDILLVLLPATVVVQPEWLEGGRGGCPLWPDLEIGRSGHRVSMA